MQGTPLRVHASGVLSNDQGEVPRLRHFDRGESSRVQEVMVHTVQKWDVERVLMNGGSLVRFPSGSFLTERRKAAWFVSGLRLSLRASVSMFYSTTLQEVVARALEGESAHCIQQAKRALGQSVQSGH